MKAALRFELLKRRKARLAKQNPPVVPVKATFGSITALYTGNF